MKIKPNGAELLRKKYDQEFKSILEAINVYAIEMSMTKTAEEAEVFVTLMIDLHEKREKLIKKINQVGLTLGRY